MMNFEDYRTKMPYGIDGETREAYHRDCFRLEQKFKLDLFEEFGIARNPSGNAFPSTRKVNFFNRAYTIASHRAENAGPDRWQLTYAVFNELYSLWED